MFRRTAVAIVVLALVLGAFVVPALAQEDEGEDRAEQRQERIEARQERAEERRVQFSERFQERANAMWDRVEARMQRAIDRFTQIHERLTEKFAELSERGYDTEAAEGYLDAAAANIASAELALAEAGEAYLALFDAEEPRAAFGEVRQHVEEVVTSLKSARVDMKEAIAVLRAEIDGPAPQANESAFDATSKEDSGDDDDDEDGEEEEAEDDSDDDSVDDEGEDDEDDEEDDE